MFQKIKNFYHLIQSLLVNLYYGFPARKMTIIGVTGTDGKTTTTSMIYQILSQNGFNSAMISTILAKTKKEVFDTGLHITTPEPWDLPRILSKFEKSGVTHVVIESTSSGLDQNRLFGISYDSVIITNIGSDHLDYHKTWKNYAKAKFKIVKKTQTEGLVVLNKDHKSKRWLNNQISKIKQNIKIKWFSINELEDITHSIEGIKFRYQATDFKIPIIGEYNFSNALGVIKLAERYLELDQIANSLQKFKTPLGRMQIMQKEPVRVIIDFAHTPSSLEEALSSVQDIKTSKDTRIICVFGCAGERDPERRKMGAVSTRMADITVVTLEDPRTEVLRDINNEIIEHGKKEGGKLRKRFSSHQQFSHYINNKMHVRKGDIFSFDYENIQNRKDAIDFALKIALKNDIVFITGKGHEQSLAIGSPIIEYEYNDQDTVKELLKKKTSSVIVIQS
ncbi:UDP-N-acetylmuramyl-tripeptide synthetase [Candidatus Dojkabacteria bacterium]|nr:UDP-N-acetylmuramyl-tripeptide synthetase [Candidatus Dojkabacteria bacterium]